jgi:serine/threonine protein kinase
MPEWIGKTIGKVRIEKYLAHGAMAEVYLGSHLTLDRPVAIKVLHSYTEEDPDLLARFQREAKVVASLRHPNIVQIYDYDTVDGHPYIVMEYLKGPTLATYLRGLHAYNSLIPSHQVARLLKGLADALDYAHGQGVVHRDVKPGNIMLHGEADEIPLDQPLSSDVEGILTDFGLVYIAHSAHQTATGTISGTPAYMSPEQARGDKTDHRTDIYSLGVVLYEMLAGRVPFDGDTTMSLIYKHINDPPPPIPGISSAAQEVMNRALAKKPDDRYQTCREMAMDFFLAIGLTAEAETIHTTLTGSPDATVKTIRERKPKHRFTWWIVAAIFSFLCVLALGAGTLRMLAPVIFPSFAKAATDTPLAQVVSPTAQVHPTETTQLPDGKGMVEITSGTYGIGSSQADEFHSPSQSISLDDFWIDVYQITNAQYGQFLDKTGGQPPEIWPGKENNPVRGVTWEQASSYCAWVNKRLPTEAEWEVAGRGPGPNPHLYPWGDDPTAGGKALDLPVQDTYEVGTQPFNVSVFGLYDLVGNVWEWVGKPYASVPEGYKVLHGGRFGLPQDLAYRLVIAPDDELYIKYAGFRCAADQVK